MPIVPTVAAVAVSGTVSNGSSAIGSTAAGAAAAASPCNAWGIAVSTRVPFDDDRLRRRSGLLDPAGRVGGGRRRGERRQRRCRRGRACVAVHRGGVLGPHLGVVDFGGRDSRGVLPEHVGRDQRHQQGAVGRDHRRRHRRRERGLIGSCRRPGLGGCLFGLRGSRGHPIQIRGGRRRHLRRRRAQPGPAGQLGDRRPVGRRGGLEFGGQRVPRRGRCQHRPRAGAGIHSRGIDFRRQRREIHCAVLTQQAVVAFAASVAA